MTNMSSDNRIDRQITVNEPDHQSRISNVGADLKRRSTLILEDGVNKSEINSKEELQDIYRDVNVILGDTTSSTFGKKKQ